MDPIETTEAEAREQTVTAQAEAPEALVEQDLLVEDVSIDGMCGVY
jgi:mycofactocin precursor